MSSSKTHHRDVWHLFNRKHAFIFTPLTAMLCGYNIMRTEIIKGGALYNIVKDIKGLKEF